MLCTVNMCLQYDTPLCFNQPLTLTGETLWERRRRYVAGMNRSGTDCSEIVRRAAWPRGLRR
jgi:hypothetical protein